MSFPEAEPQPGEDTYLAGLIAGPMAPVPARTLELINSGPVDGSDMLSRDEVDRLRDPAPLDVETGWCRMPDGTVRVAVEVGLPGITTEMVEWFLVWHIRRSQRYRAWHPRSHFSCELVRDSDDSGKPQWSGEYHPVEDVGSGKLTAWPVFRSPSEFGFSDDCVGDERVATVFSAEVGDWRLIGHTGMCHVFLNEADGLRLRSRFWIGEKVHPRLPGLLGSAGESLLSRKFVRDQAVPDGIGPGLATHSAEEYANLVAILPGLYEKFA